MASSARGKGPGRRSNDWVASPGAGNAGRMSTDRYVEQCRSQAMAVRSKKEFGKLSLDTLVYVALEHRLTTIRLGAVKALESGDTRRHLAALRTIERTPSAGPPVRAAAHQAGDVVEARLTAR